MIRYAGFLFLVLFSAQGFIFASDWSTQASHTLSNLYGVSSAGVNTFVAVGDGGTILRSTDAGLGWSVVTSPVADQLRAVALHGNVGLAVGLSGQVLRSTDEGASWVQESRPTSKNLYSVALGDSVAIITGEEGTIFISTDAGVSWSQRTAGTASVIFGVTVKGPTAVGVGGQATVVMSDDNGQGWGLTVLGPTQQLFFYGTSFATPTTGWAVGSYQPTGSIILKSTSSGFTWTVQSSPTTNILFGVSFTSADTGTAVGMSGTIVNTTNGGTDWVTRQSNTLQTLNAVSFVDGRTGIAVGDSGTILRTVTGGGITSVREVSRFEEPVAFQLRQNFPNPFNPETNIEFQVLSPGSVELTVLDVLGREIGTIVNEVLPPGSYRRTWDAGNLSSGVYYYRLEAKSASDPGRPITQMKKMVLVR